MRDPLNDAALMISWDAFSDSIAWRLDFCRLYPDFKHSLEVLTETNHHAILYLSGIDNSPVYDWDTNMLLDEVKNSYTRYMSSYPNSELTPVIAGALTVWKENAYQYNEKVKEYLNSLTF
jgi:hypothetical protein